MKSYDLRPSHPYCAGTENIGFSLGWGGGAVGRGGVLISCTAVAARPQTLASLQSQFGFSRTRQTSRAPDAERREVFGGE